MNKEFTILNMLKLINTKNTSVFSTLIDDKINGIKTPVEIITSRTFTKNVNSFGGLNEFK